MTETLAEVSRVAGEMMADFGKHPRALQQLLDKAKERLKDTSLPEDAAASVDALLIESATALAAASLLLKAAAKEALKKLSTEEVPS